MAEFTGSRSTKIERDHAEVVGGVVDGTTTGAPVAMRIVNRDFANQPPEPKPPEGQRGVLEQQQLELLETVRDLARADSLQRAERARRDSARVAPLYLGRTERVVDVADRLHGQQRAEDLLSQIAQKDREIARLRALVPADRMFPTEDDADEDYDYDMCPSIC